MQRLLVARLHPRVLRREVNRRVAANGRQIIGQHRHIAPFRQLTQSRRLEGERVQVFVNLRQRPAAPHQIERRFFTDARHAGDVVGSVAHQRLEVDDSDGFKAVFPVKAFGRHFAGRRLPHAGRHQLDAHLVGDELQAVAVACDDNGFPPGLGRFFRHSADKIVGFPPGQLAAGDAQSVQRFFEQRQLRGQLVGHPLALRLVARVLLVPEGRLPAVKGDAQRVGRFIGQQLEQNVEKPVYGVGRRAVRGGQRLHAVKGAVYQAVAVEHHQLHGLSSCKMKHCFYVSLL